MCDNHFHDEPVWLVATVATVVALMEMLGDGARGQTFRALAALALRPSYALFRTAPIGAFSPAGSVPISSVDLIAGVC